MDGRIKTIFIAVICIISLAFPLVKPCSAAQKVEVVNDGSQLILNINNRQIMGDQPPYIANNCTLVPIGVVAKELGANVEWNQSARTVTINKGKQIVLTIGSTTATVNGSPTTLQAPAVITNGRTMVPLRFVSEALGTEVSYIPSPGATIATVYRFQTDNSAPIKILRLKRPQDLKDTQTASIISGMILMPSKNWYDWADNLKNDGFTEVRGNINFSDGVSLNLRYADIEKQVPADWVNYFKYLKKNGIKVRYQLSFWDMNYRLDGGIISKDRLHSEEELTRYLNYVKMVVTNLKGLVNYYDLWNEPEIKSKMLCKISPLGKATRL